MTNSTILDMEAIEEARAVMKDKFPTMVEYFMEDTEMYINSIKEGVANVSIEKIVSPAHTLKSSSRQMGATRVSEISKEIEALAREQSSGGENNMEVLAAMIVTLEGAFHATREAYKQLG